MHSYVFIIHIDYLFLIGKFQDISFQLFFMIRRSLTELILLSSLLSGVTRVHSIRIISIDDK